MAEISENRIAQLTPMWISSTKEADQRMQAEDSQIEPRESNLQQRLLVVLHRVQIGSCIPRIGALARSARAHQLAREVGRPRAALWLGRDGGALRWAKEVPNRTRQRAKVAEEEQRCGMPKLAWTRTVQGWQREPRGPDRAQQKEANDPEARLEALRAAKGQVRDKVEAELELLITMADQMIKSKMQTPMKLMRGTQARARVRSGAGRGRAERRRVEMSSTPSWMQTQMAELREIKVILLARLRLIRTVSSHRLPKKSTKRMTLSGLGSSHTIR